MERESDKMRRILNLVEEAQTRTLIEGWVDKLAAKFKGKSMGEAQREKMANQLWDEWNDWLGSTRRDGNKDDLIRFMTHRIGFTETDVAKVLKTSAWISLDDKPELDARPEEKKPAGKAEPAAATQAAEKKPEEPKSRAYDPDEDGRPIPKDLNTKLSDYGVVGMSLPDEEPKDAAKGEEETGVNIRHEPADDVEEPDEIIEDPKKYKDSVGNWNRKMISKKLKTLPYGTKLTLGDATFSRTKGTNTNESMIIISENGYETAYDEEVFDEHGRIKPEIVQDILDYSAGYINDQYLLNGPKQDEINLAAKAAAELQQGQGGSSKGGSSAMPKGTGGYDKEEMAYQLRQVEIGKSQLDSLKAKTVRSENIGRMTDSDMDELARIGWAFLKSKN